MMGTYMKDSITLNMHTGMDKWQTQATSTDVTVKGFIEYKERRLQNAQGQVVVSLAKVYMKPRTIIKTGFSTRATDTISYEDKLVFDGVTHSIITISMARDFSIRAMEVYVA